MFQKSKQSFNTVGSQSQFDKQWTTSGKRTKYMALYQDYYYNRAKPKYKTS